MYLVAAKVRGAPALWAMPTTVEPAEIYSVNAHAYDVAGFGRVKPPFDSVTEQTDGAAEALECLASLS